MTALTTDTWEKLAKPENRAKQIVEETTFAEITTGTEKQIELATNLRSEFLVEVSAVAIDANVRWAIVKQERNQRLSNDDVMCLARDAWYRRTILKTNTNDAKFIIDWFLGTSSKQMKLDSISRYANIINYPSKWSYNGNSWEKK